jgi:hypothetical protein
MRAHIALNCVHELKYNRAYWATGAAWSNMQMLKINQHDGLFIKKKWDGRTVVS